MLIMTGRLFPPYQNSTFNGVLIMLWIIVVIIALIIVAVIVSLIIGYLIIKRIFVKAMDDLDRFDLFEEEDFHEFFLLHDGDINDIEYYLKDKMVKSGYIEMQLNTNETDRKRVLKYVGLKIQKLKQEDYKSIVIKVLINNNIHMICGYIKEINMVKEIANIPNIYKGMLMDAFEDDGSSHQYFIYYIINSDNSGP